MISLISYLCWTVPFGYACNELQRKGNAVNANK
jgi:hypothetical protein